MKAETRIDITSMRFFTLCEDKKFAKCNQCAELVSQGEHSSKTFNTTNLVSDLNVNHPVIYNSFCRTKENKDSQRQAAKRERVQSGLNKVQF